MPRIYRQNCKYCFERDVFKCAICKTNRDITVHHIDYVKTNCSEVNLITLCRGHNSKVNYNRKFWQIYFEIRQNGIPVKLNLGCGESRKPKEEGWINIDIMKSVDPDLVMDISSESEWIKFFSENSVSEVLASYSLCQIPQSQPKKFISAMNNIWKVLSPNALFKILVPNACYPRAFTDPMDSRYFTPDTFDYFNHEHYRYQRFHYGFKPWKILSITPIHGGIVMINDRLYVEMQKYELS